MAGVFPSAPGFTEVRTRSQHFGFFSESINGRTQSRSLGASRREFTLVFPPMKKATFQPVHDFIESQQGHFGTFSITLPDPSNAGTDFTITARLANDVQEFSYGLGQFYTYEVDIIEVV